MRLQPMRGAAVHEDVGHAAGLADAGHVAAPQPGVDLVDVRRAAGRQVDEAHAVGAQDRGPGRASDVGHLDLHPGGRLAALDDAAARDDDGRHPRLGRLRG